MLFPRAKKEDWPRRRVEIVIWVGVRVRLVRRWFWRRKRM